MALYVSQTTRDLTNSVKFFKDLPGFDDPVDQGTMVDAASVDWTTLGVVSPVKYQGQCGICSTFSTTGCLVSLSEQQFEDCDCTCSGCNGDLMDYAFAFAQQNAVCTEKGHHEHASVTEITVSLFFAHQSGDGVNVLRTLAGAGETR